MDSDSIPNVVQDQREQQNDQQDRSSSNEIKGSVSEVITNRCDKTPHDRGDDISSSSSRNGRRRCGYSADCSSSDSSSEASSTKKQQPSVDLSVDNMTLDEGKERVNNHPNCVSEGLKAHFQKKQLQRARRAARVAQRSAAEIEYDLESLCSSTYDAVHTAAEIGALEELMRQSRKLLDTPEMTLGLPLPQWKGIRISHPMDPRIDLSTVNRVQASDAPLTDELHRAQFIMPGPPPSVDNYLHLMEAVKPFFSAYGAYQMQQPILANPAIDQVGPVNEYENYAECPHSSEGFTSFFSTTNSSDSTSAAKCGTGNELAPNQCSTHVECFNAISSWSNGPPICVSDRVGQGEPIGAVRNGSPDDDVSDSSSMIVLARAKRKHSKNNEKGESSSGDSIATTLSNSPGMPPPVDKQIECEASVCPPEKAGGTLERASPLSSSSSSEAPEPQHHGARHHPMQYHGAPHHAHQHHETQRYGAEQPVHQGHAAHNQPRIVSESSAESLQRSSDQFSSSNNANTTSGSGSGSAGNSGSGSAGNSGGDGNSGSGGDGKGSSTDAAKGDNSGDQNSNSDENNRDKQAKATDVDVEHTTSTRNHLHDAMHYVQCKPLPAESREGDVSREFKLMDKKRKRMNMRREYEEQVQHQLDSSESSGSIEDEVICPGKPVTLEAVLSFTKIARMVVQSAPPFLVVHVNAQYSGLTGIDSHHAIGKPIHVFLSIPDPQTLAFFDAAAVHAESMAGDAEVMSSVSGNSSLTNSANGRAVGHIEKSQRNEASGGDNVPEHQSETLPIHLDSNANHFSHTRYNAFGDERFDINLERLVAMSGFGHYHIIQVSAKAHHMLGRNVTVIRENMGAGGSRQPPRLNANPNRDGGSRGENIFSGDTHYHTIPCRMAVSPVTSSPNAFIDHGSIVTEQDQGKRRKQYYNYMHPPDGSVGSRNCMHRGRQHQGRNHLITHFVIQLERVPGDVPTGMALESLLSASIPVNQNEAPGDEDLLLPDIEDHDADVDDVTESTDAIDPVVVIG